MPIEVYILSTGKEKAAIEKERMPKSADTESDRRRLGRTPKKNTAQP